MTLAQHIEAAWTRGGPLQWLLRPLSGLMRLLVASRRGLYRRGWLRSERLPVPVVVVGNRIVGGAGKTPTTLALVKALQAGGWQPAIVSRGHGASSSAPRAVRADSSAIESGDEPLLLQRRTGVPVWVGRDRVAVARALIAAHPGVDVLICDDGLQHLRLQRDLELVVFDERGAGNGWLLPAGPLREPINAPAAAPQLVLYNAPAPSTALPGACAQRHLAGLVTLAAWWNGTPATLEALESVRSRLAGSKRARPVAASAGIGQPQRFFDGLRAAGLTVQPLPLPDHHDFRTLPWPADLDELIVTEKDAIKLDPERMARERPGLRVWVAPLEFELPPDFIAAVLARLATLHRLEPRRSS